MTGIASFHRNVVGLGLGIFAFHCYADTVDDLLKRLKAKGILNQKEISAMQKRSHLKPGSAPEDHDKLSDLVTQLHSKGVLSDSDYADLMREQSGRPGTTVKGGRDTATGTGAGQTVTTDATPAGTSVSDTPTQTAGNPNSGPFVRMLDKGIGLHLGPVDLSIAGSVNTFYVHDMPDDPGDNRQVLGGLANVNRNDSASVRNGLLPGNFTANLKTQQRGFDIGVTFGLYPGLNSVTGNGGANSPGSPTALGTSGIDFRQQFITVGNDSFGTLKAGRDIGVFGSDAILNDFSLISVGSPGSNVAPSNTALGRIGLGYVYTDFFPQINYSRHLTSTLDGTIGVFSPFSAVNFSSLSGTLTAHDQPGFHGKLNYKSSFGDVKAQLWSGFVTQALTSDSVNDALPIGSTVRGYGFDFGGKLSYGPADLTAYGYYGDGLGTTALFFDAVSTAGRTRESSGFYVQGTYELLPRLTLGLSHGASYLDLAAGEVNPLLVNVNESQLVGLRYELTDWVRLVGEYVHTRSEAHNNNSANEHTLAIGAALFF